MEMRNELSKGKPNDKINKGGEITRGPDKIKTLQYTQKEDIGRKNLSTREGKDHLPSEVVNTAQ